jgi:NDP-sugar pyrophosphorylase family protein
MTSDFFVLIPANIVDGDVNINNISELSNDREFTRVLAYCQDAKGTVVGLNKSSNGGAPGQREFNGINVKFLPGTKGALATVGLLLDLVPEEMPIFVVPTNSFIKESLQEFYDAMELTNADVGLALVNSIEPELSYVRMINDKIVEIHEKEVVSDLAISGHFYFKNKSIIRDCLNWSMLNNINKDGSFYIAPSLNFCITKGMKVASFHVDSANYFHRTQTRR